MTFPLELVDEKCAGPVNCALSSADVGPRTDVEAVRRLMNMDLPLILFVKVSGNYAYGREMSAGDDEEDGCAIFHRKSGAWTFSCAAVSSSTGLACRR